MSATARYPAKTLQNQNKPSDLSKRPVYIFSIFNQNPDKEKKLGTQWPNCPKVKMSHVKMSQNQNVPIGSQDIPKSKRPKVKNPKLKISPSQKAPVLVALVCLSVCKQHYSKSLNSRYVQEEIYKFLPPSS